MNASVGRIMALQDGPQAFLESLGLKVTTARVRIVECLWRHAENCDHVSAEQLYLELHKAGNRFGLATVYRVLANLEACGVVRRRQFSRGHTVFEFAKAGLHHHMVEADGKTILEFADAGIEQRLQALAAERGYEYLDSELVIYVRARHAEPFRQVLPGA
jgi:Fur family transcriptional regulator, ferric uptake regulator